MISILSQIITRHLIKTEAISERDSNLYEYAAYSFIFSLAPILLVIIIGAILGMLLEGVLMIIPFVLLRKFSGGQHLKSPLVCFLSSIALLSASLIGIKYVIQSGSLLTYSLFVVLSTVIIYTLSPIDTNAKKLTEKELKIFRRIARVIGLVICSLYFLLVYFEMDNIAIPIGAGLLITALLQIPGGLQRFRKRKKTNNCTIS